MGVLLSAVAVRHGSAEDVADVVRLLMRDVGHPVDPGIAPSPDGIVVTAAVDGWVAVHPHYVVQPHRLAVELTRRLDTIGSAVGIYEDVFWTHDLVDRGTVVDRHVNFPDYFGAGEYDDSFAGDPSVVASALGADPAEIAPYFEQVSLRRARSRWSRPPKAHPDDHHHLLDGWVVTELWSRMGIAWADPSGAGTALIPLDRAQLDALTEWLRERS